MTPILSARALGKRYTIRPERSLALGLVRRYRPRQLWALRGLDLDLAGGEILAVVGRNGAGKSTLLKLAAGVTRPTEGSLRRPRRIAPLIEVGAGFHPELTGRENVEVNGRLLGLSARQIRQRFDEIVEFAEMAHAIDQPIKQYSSGMYMRLGFAVAVHTEPEVLVVDEVLAVGDLPFQVRCLERIKAMREAGVGILFVSHNLAAVLNVADRGLLLDGGAVVHEGAVDEVVDAYHGVLGDSARDSAGVHEEMGASGDLVVERLDVVDEHGGRQSMWWPGDRVVVRADLLARAPTPAGTVGFRLAREGSGVIATWLGGEHECLPPLAPGERITMQLALTLNVTEGGYWLTVGVARTDWKGMLLAERDAVRIGVGARPGAGGIADLAPSVEMSPAMVR